MKLLLDLQDARSIWAMPAWVPERIRAALPEGWSVQVMDEPTEGTGDGGTRVSTVAIVGFGGIGKEIGRRVAALGARVLGGVRAPRAQALEPLTAVGSEALLGHAELLPGAEGTRRLLAESDVVVLAAPDTPATRG